MCYHIKQEKDIETIEKRFNAKAAVSIQINSSHYNGFTHPQTPVITNLHPHLIQLFNWGLIPSWSKDKDIQKFTLNAKIETITEKPSFRGNVKNRCLIIADGFFEWQWLDPKGKQKQQYFISLPGEEPFAMAGIYSAWTDKETGEILHTYSIITTEADSFMAEIHNSKKRMPLVLTPANEKLWLQGNNIEEFTNPEIKLVAIAI